MISYQPLLSGMTRNFIPDESVGGLVAQFLSRAPDQVFNKHVESIASSQKVFRGMNSSSKLIEDFAKYKIVAKVDVIRVLKFQLYVFKSHKDKIATFLFLRSTFEGLLVNGQYKDAKIKLDEIERAVGESLWLVRARFLLLSKVSDGDELQCYCNEVLERSSDDLVRQVVNTLVYIYGSPNKNGVLKNLVYRTIKELRSGGAHDSAMFQEMLFVPHDLRGGLRSIDHLKISQIFPLVDQYEIVVSELAKFLSDFHEEDDETRHIVTRYLKKLSDSVNDNRLENSISIFSGKSHPSIPPTVDELLRDYESGSYSDVVTKLNNSICDYKSAGFLLNIFAKSLAHSHQPLSSTEGVLDKSIEALRKIYVLDGDINKFVDEIRSCIIELQGSLVGFSLQLSLAICFPYSRKLEETKRLYRNGSVYIDCSLPLVSAMLDSNKYAYDSGITFHESGAVAEERSLRNLVLMSGSFTDQDLRMLKDLGCLDKDIIELQIGLLVKQSWEELLSFSSRILAGKPYLFSFFPMQSMVEYIERDFYVSIDSVIICYIYSKSISQEKGLLFSEVFDEFVMSSGLEYPSEMLNALTSYRDREIYFFKTVCSIESMDCMPIFKDSFELRAERLNILDRLYRDEKVDSRDYYDESDKIVDQIIKDVAAHQINTSKIYVNTDAVFSIVSDEILSLFEIFKNTGDFSHDSERLIVLNKEKDSYNYEDAFITEQAFVSGGRKSIISKMIDYILEQYLFNENYGLDANLSTEIRHGFFSNFIRAGVENHELVTEQIQEGEYESNVYWEGVYSGLLYPHMLDEIDKSLKNFSKGFDELIEEAKKWMHVTFNEEMPDAVFSYSFEIDKLSQLQLKIESSDSYEEVVYEILRDLTEQTDINIASMQEKLNVDFKRKCGDLFQGLTYEIDKLLGGKGLEDLKTAIERGNAETLERIDSISDWFNRSGKNSFSNQSLRLVVNIAIDCFVKIKSMQYFPEKSLLPEEMSRNVYGEHVKPLVLCLINLLDNAYRHSGLGRSTKIIIREEEVGIGSMITVINNLEKSSNFNSIIEAEKINDFIRDSSDDSLMRTEGGTGLAKVKYYLGSISAESSISVKFEDNMFVAQIYYV